MASYLSVSDYLNRSDVVSVADLCSRGTPGASPSTPIKLPSATDLQTNAILLAALAGASGMVLGACTQGFLYTDSDLQALTGNSLANLQRMVAQLTDCLLWEGRRMGVGDIPPPPFYDRVHKELERLERGERLF